ncbi:MAG: outer membrane lipoprotein-sorting protein [Spirochaetaceae bacterium]|nr:outer membrane lipoprotein-sorting protein [Spirochaetaceae bacterium]
MSRFPPRLLLARALLAPALLLLPLGLNAEDPGAAEVLARVDRVLFLESYASRATMETREPGQEPRSMTFESLSRRDKGSYLEVVAPARTKGTRFLQLEGSLWMFNPKSGSANPIRLSSRDSFQGSTLSNADVGKNQFSDEYAPAFLPEAVLEHAELGPVPCRVIEGKAKGPEAAYGKIVMWLRKSDSMPLRMEYYAKSGLLFKRMDLSAIKSFGATTRPSVLRMESLEKKGTVSTLTIESIEPREVPASVFNKNWLTR